MKHDATTVLRLRIADVLIDVRARSPFSTTGLTERYGCFFADPDDGPCAVELVVGWSGLERVDPPTDRVVFDSGGLWSMYRSSRGKTTIVSGHPGDPALTRVAHFEHEFNKGEILVYGPAGDRETSELIEIALEYPLLQLVMVIKLSSMQAMMVNACGIDESGKALVYMASDGELRRRSREMHDRGGRVVNDSVVILRVRDGRLLMFGTPWHDREPTKEVSGIEVERLILLEDGAPGDAEAVRGSRAVMGLLTRGMVSYWSHEGVSNTVGFCEAATNLVPTEVRRVERQPAPMTG